MTCIREEEEEDHYHGSTAYIKTVPTVLQQQLSPSPLPQPGFTIKRSRHYCYCSSITVASPSSSNRRHWQLRDGLRIVDSEENLISHVCIFVRNVMILQCLYVTTFTETEDFPVHRNGIVQPGMASQLQGTLADLTPSIYRSDTALKTIEALSEGTITDSTPGSAVNYHTPSLEEGTILSSVSSYRSIAERPPGLCLL